MERTRKKNAVRLYIPGFDLKGTADSGQCFRLLPEGAGSWGLIAHGEYLKIKDMGESWFDFVCTRKAYESVWKTYFDLERDYQRIHALIHPGDGYLYDAANYARGIRILKQEPFETLISFIISQRKNLPAIRHCVRQLSLSYGERIEKGIHAFPTPVALAEASMDGLLACSLGYRAKYIRKTAQMVAEGTPDLNALHDLSDEELQTALMTLSGVGVKVAQCVMLFAYHRMDAFPVDVWIERVLRNEFPDGFPFDRFPGSAGIIQQYLFCYAREQGRRQLVK